MFNIFFGIKNLGKEVRNVKLFCFNKRNQKFHSLQRALFIKDDELNEIGKSTLKLLDNSSFKESHNSMSWLIQAISEFQDLQGGQIYSSSHWMKQGYCFFESLHVIRESILAGLNSYYHVSISGLRSAYELLLLHSYWESHKSSIEDYDQFLKWIEGKESKLSFKKLLKKLKDMVLIPPHFQLSERFGDTYGKLCSYAHTPILKESFTKLKKSNLPTLNTKAITYWMNLFNEALKCLLDLLIVCYPMSLFPVDTIKKFGFNPPMGLFFNKQNCRSVKRAIGFERYDESRKWFLANDSNVDSLLDWFNGFKDLSIEEVKNTWNIDEKETKEYKKLMQINSLDDLELEQLIFLRKLKVRVIQLQFIYYDLSQ